MRGVSQPELAKATGVSVATIRRLESGRMDNPPLRYLVNCALALGVELDTLIEKPWREWKVFDTRSPEPPSREGFWREGFR